MVPALLTMTIASGADSRSRRNSESSPVKAESNLFIPDTSPNTDPGSDAIAERQAGVPAEERDVSSYTPNDERRSEEGESGGLESSYQTVGCRGVRRALHLAGLVQQVVLDNVANELSSRVQMHFLKNTRPVRAHGLIAQRQDLGNFTNGSSRPHQAHHFKLTTGQRVMRRAIRVPFEIHHETFGQCWTDVPSSGDHLRDRAGQLRARAVLRDVAGRACLEGAPSVLFFRMHAQHENRHPWTQLFELAHQLQAASTHERNVDDGEIPGVIGGELQRLDGRRRFAEFVANALLTDDGLQPVAYDLMVVDQEHFAHGLASFGAARSGTRTVIVVPCPGTPMTSSVAPTRVARSPMPRMPRERTAERSSSEMPLPLSRTRSVKAPDSTPTHTSTRVAPEWRRMLVNASCRIRNTAVDCSFVIVTGPTAHSQRVAIPVHAWNC